MKVRYITSACVVIEHNNVQVLCDPWLTEGIYYGSWYHYPPLEFKPNEFFAVDYVYISHIHPDHLDIETLKKFPFSTKILIHDYAVKSLFYILKGLGFQHVRSAPPK